MSVTQCLQGLKTVFNGVTRLYIVDVDLKTKIALHFEFNKGVNDNYHDFFACLLSL